MKNPLRRFKTAVFALVRYEVDVAGQHLQDAEELAARAVELGMAPGEVVAITSMSIQEQQDGKERIAYGAVDNRTNRVTGRGGGDA